MPLNWIFQCFIRDFVRWYAQLPKSVRNITSKKRKGNRKRFNGRVNPKRVRGYRVIFIWSTSKLLPPLRVGIILEQSLKKMYLVQEIEEHSRGLFRLTGTDYELVHRLHGNRLFVHEHNTIQTQGVPDLKLFPMSPSIFLRTANVFARCGMKIRRFYCKKGFFVRLETISGLK